MTHRVPFVASQRAQWHGENMSGFDTERFIELVRERPFLYDGKDKKHGNRDIVQKAWEDISKEMDCEGNRWLLLPQF
jgi:hypothetical protein